MPTPTLKKSVFYFFVFSFSFFFLKKKLSKYLDNKSFAFPKKLGFLFSCGFGVFLFFFLSLTSGWKLSFFPLRFHLWTRESSFSELYLTLQRGKWCERRGRRENQ